MKLNRLYELREEKGWTQTFVAYKLSISQRTYSHYENGDRNLPIELLIQIAYLYDVSADYILNMTNNSNKHWEMRDVNYKLSPNAEDRKSQKKL